MYVTGNRGDLLAKLGRFEADGYILDLEDGVPPAEKEAAREIISREAPKHIAEGRVLHVRVNPVHTEWHRGDIEMAVGIGIGRIHAPKIASADDLRAVDHYVFELAVRWGLELDKIELYPTIETSRAVLAGKEICEASEHIAGLVLGSDDLTAEWGVHRTSDGHEINYVRQRMIVLANAYGAFAIDSTYPFHKDIDGCRRDAERARSMGFRGKQAIHPDQCPIYNDSFAPSKEEIERARSIIDAAEDARSMGHGTASAAGTQIDAAVEKSARRLLELADFTP